MLTEYSGSMKEVLTAVNIEQNCEMSSKKAVLGSQNLRQNLVKERKY